MPEYVNAKNVACYLHMDKGEVETTGIIMNAFSDRECQRVEKRYTDY